MMEQIDMPLLPDANKGSLLTSQVLNNPKLKQYLKLIIERMADNVDVMKKLGRFVDRKELKKLVVTIKLEKGETIEDISKYFTAEEVAELKNRRELKLLNTNKKIYALADTVQLQLLMKNVKKVDIKVYEIDLEKHLLATHAPLDEQVNLSFLKPTFVQQLETGHTNPFQIF
jgi:hypothetical protein